MRVLTGLAKRAENGGPAQDVSIVQPSNTPPRSAALLSPLMNFRRALQSLLILVLGLPLLEMTLNWIEQLLSALGDRTACDALCFTSTCLRVLWLAALVGLLVVISLDALARTAKLEMPSHEDSD